MSRNNDKSTQQDVLDARLKERMAQAIRAAAQLGKNEGRARVEQQAGLFRDETFGALASLRVELEAAEQHYQELSHKLSAAHVLDSDTPPFVEGKAMESADGAPLPSWFSFLPIDQLKAVMFGLLTLSCMVLSLVNTQVTLMSSFIPALMENPWKAWLIAGIAPAITTSIKLLPAVVSRPLHKELCKKGIYLLTGICGLIWVYMFSVQFDGFSSGNDWSSEGGSVFGLSFTFFQLATEILCGASMFTAFQAVLDKYQPTVPVPNAAKGLSTEHTRQTQLACDKALKAYQDIQDRYTAHEAARQSFINEQVDAFLIALARHNDLHR